MYSKNELINLYKNPEYLLQNLIKFNTTNPPGQEEDCILYIKELLESASIETCLYYKEDKRPNLIARIKGKGVSSPLLAYGHIDVVTADNQKWDYPPFEGIIAEDCVWGRGAIDMKGGVVMMLSSILRMKLEDTLPPGDIIFAAVSDEEVGECGAKYLVESHGELFAGVKYAIGEFGGFTMFIDDKKFYPIMISEKQLCSIKVTFRGPGGHGSIPVKNSAMAKAGRFLTSIDKHKLPIHITKPVEIMINTMAGSFNSYKKFFLKKLLNKIMNSSVLNALGSNGTVLEPLFRNSINPTIINGGNKINVIPGEVSLYMDGRILPGVLPDDFIREIKAIGGNDLELSIEEYDEGPSSFDMGLFDTLGNIIKGHESDGIPLPFMVSGVTDARFFSKLGIQTYGYTPMLLPKDINFSELMHSSNERIPIPALHFGTNCIYELFNRF